MKSLKLIWILVFHIWDLLVSNLEISWMTSLNSLWQNWLSSRPNDTILHQLTKPSLVQIMACLLLSDELSCEWYTVQCHYNAVNFLTNIHKRHHIAEVSFVDSVSDWFSACVLSIIYAICYYIGPRYNGTRLYWLIVYWTPKPNSSGN